MKRPAAVAFILVILLLSGCGDQIEPGTTSGTPPIVKGLSFQKIAATPLPAGETFVGTVESSARGILAARIDGQVTRILVKGGDQVKAGQLLLVLGHNLAADQLRQAEAGLAQAQSGKATAQAQLSLAEKTYARYHQLFEKQAITPQEMDQMTANLDVARKGLESTQAAVALATSGRDAARVAAGYSQITAPYPARVVGKQVEVGSTVMPGQPLLTLDRHGSWQVRTEIPEALAGRIQVKSTLAVEIPTLGQTVTATVAEVQPAADPKSRTFQVKLDLPQLDGLVAGLYARIVYSATGAQGILVPQAALVTRGQLHAVFVREGQTLHLRMVRVGRKLGDQQEILAGLAAGETIVSAGAERASNGARVEE